MEFYRKLLNPITSFSIAIEMFKILSQLKNEKYESLLNWIYRFLNRNHYSFRNQTYLGQLLPKKSFEITSIFLSDLYKSCITMKYDDEVIVSMDVTPININMPPNYMITKKGKKNHYSNSRSRKVTSFYIINNISWLKKIKSFSYL